VVAATVLASEPRGEVSETPVGAAHEVPPATAPLGFVDTLIVPNNTTTGARIPTAVEYEPGTGNLWVLEKGGGSSEGQARVRVRDAVTGVISTALTLDCVDSTGERGLLGIAPSPDYLDPGGLNRYVYLYYTRRFTDSGPCHVSGEPDGSRNRVSRFLESGSVLSGEEVIYEAPYLTSAANHNGGTLRFAPDGTLFISMGDNDTDTDPSPLSRDLGDPRGKLLRINGDGTIPADNPFVGVAGVLPEIWAWGLRNPFRFSIDPETEAPLIGDVGQASWEAIYAGVPGADYGYPCLEGSAPFQACDPEPPPGSVTNPIFEYSHGDLTPPVSGDSVTGGPVYRSGSFPAEYHDNYFFGDYVGSWIRRARLTEDNQLVDIEIFLPDADNVTDIIISPDGCLTWVSLFLFGTSGGVYETCFVGGTNSQPQARASAVPTSGLAPLDVQFTGSLSSDSDGDTLVYSWDFDDGGSSSSADPQHTYMTDGVYEAVLTVDDQQAEVNSVDDATPVRIVVGNESPSATIDAPAVGATYDAGDTIVFSGSASDPEEGTLGAENFSWTVIFHHDTHTHPFLGPIEGVSSGEFTIPTSGEDSPDVFYRIHLTVTDSGVPLGATAWLTDSTFVDVVPNVSQITLAAEPPGIGLELEFDQEAAAEPVVRDSVVNFPRTIGAPSPQMADGSTWEFSSWSDGGAAEHSIATPAVDTTYTASFICTANCPNTQPTVTLLAPAGGARFAEGTPIEFSGSAADAEDGDLTGSLAWTSDLDGAIGGGGAFQATLSVGTHTITAAVTDSGGLAGDDQVTISVDPVWTLSVATAGIGSGTVTSAPPGIMCGSGGADCAESYLDQTVVNLTPVEDLDSLFAGWSGDVDCNDGAATMTSDHSCTATFDLVVDLFLEQVSLEGTQQLDACNTITTGDNVVAAAGSTVTLRTGSAVAFRNGLVVEADAGLVVVLEPGVCPP
jgi:glucose/arabinose dehydrogenase